MLIVVCLCLAVRVAQAADNWLAITFGEKGNQLKSYYQIELVTADGNTFPITSSGDEQIIYLNENNLTGGRINFTPVNKVKWFKVECGRNQCSLRVTKDDDTGWTDFIPLDSLSGGDNYVDLSTNKKDQATTIILSVASADFINESHIKTAQQSALNNPNNYFFQIQILPNAVTEITDQIIPNLPSDQNTGINYQVVEVDGNGQETNDNSITFLDYSDIPVVVYKDEVFTPSEKLFYEFRQKEIIVNGQQFPLKDYPFVIVWSETDSQFTWSFDNVTVENHELDPFYDLFIALMKVNMNGCIDPVIPIYINGQKYMYTPGQSLTVQIK